MMTVEQIMPLFPINEYSDTFSDFLIRLIISSLHSAFGHGCRSHIEGDELSGISSSVHRFWLKDPAIILYGSAGRRSLA